MFKIFNTQYYSDAGMVRVRGFVRACVYNDRAGLRKRRGLLPNTKGYYRALYSLIRAYGEGTGTGANAYEKERTELLKEFFLLQVFEGVLRYGGGEGSNFLRKYYSRFSHNEALNISFFNLRAKAAVQRLRGLQEWERELLEEGKDRGEGEREGVFVRSLQVLSASIGYKLDYEKSSLLELITAYGVWRDKEKGEKK